MPCCFHYLSYSSLVGRWDEQRKDYERQDSQHTMTSKGRESQHNIQHTITHIKGKQMRNQCHLSDLCPTPKSSKLVQYLLTQTCKTQYKGNTATTRAPLAAINSISLQLQQNLLFRHHQTPNYRRLLTICLANP